MGGSPAKPVALTPDGAGGAAELLPAPLVPPDIDLAGLDGFMLDVQRLFASELWALSTGEEFKAALGLWGRAWQQRPPGSLPDNDRTLAAFSGAGKNWKKVKAMALRGFVKCSDGRFYHRVLCEDVKSAAARRANYLLEREKDRLRLKEWREAKKDKRETRMKHLSHSVSATVSSDVSPPLRHADRHAEETPVKRLRQGQGQGQGQKESSSTIPARETTTDLLDKLQAAAKGRIDQTSPATQVVGPIMDLIALGCDLDRHILPTIRRIAPTLANPLRTWGARWLRDEILAAKTADEARTNGVPTQDPRFIKGHPNELIFNLGCGFSLPLRNLDGALKRWREQKFWAPGTSSPPPGHRGCKIPDEYLPEDLRQPTANAQPP